MSTHITRIRIGTALATLSLLTTTWVRVAGAAPAKRPQHSAPQPSPYTHDKAFSWVTGRLERSTLEGGFWTLVYDPHPKAGDERGGRLVLEVPAGLAPSCKDGALVMVRGHLAPDSMGIDMAGPHYKVLSLRSLR